QGSVGYHVARCSVTTGWLIWNLGLDELPQQHHRFLPAQVTLLGWDGIGNAFLNDVHLGAAGDLMQGDRRLHLARHARVGESVRLANTLMRDQLEIPSAEGVTLPGAKVRERHLIGAADLGVEVMDLPGESVRWKPLGHRVRIEKRSIDALGCRTDHP